MSTADPDYKLLYEQSQKLLAESAQKLKLALLDANELRRKLSGLTSDNRVKKVGRRTVGSVPFKSH